MQGSPLREALSTKQSGNSGIRMAGDRSGSLFIVSQTPHGGSAARKIKEFGLPPPIFHGKLDQRSGSTALDEH
jgi:hypothetical protein